MNEYKYIVWAESDFHSTYKVCSTYKEAVEVRKDMRRNLSKEYKLKIEKEKC